MKWIKKWFLICPFEYDIKEVRIFEIHIRNDRKYKFFMHVSWTLGWTLGMWGSK